MFYSYFEQMLQERNTLLDSFFYDTDKLTAEEKKRLTKEKNPEGSILVVYPKAANKAYTNYPNARAFAEGKDKAVSRFVIAGVGSSDLGSCALARNVADYYNEPVASIVAGYGIKDLVTEAMGGWFSLGEANKKTYQEEKAGISQSSDDDIDFVTGNPDSKTLLNLLLNDKVKVQQLLGHSKGCLSMANALFGLLDLAADKLAARRIKEVQIVTTGAVINLPDQFDSTYQFLGSIDWFGGMNSRIGLDFTPVPGCWHHTNTSLPMSLDIQAVLAQINEANEVEA